MMYYGHGGDVYAPHLRGTDLLDFSVNLNPLGLPPGVKALFPTLAESCVAYPDPYCRELRRKLSHFEGVAEEAILCGNGAADLIYRTAYALRPHRVLVPAPTFSEYEAASRQAGAEVVHAPLPEDEGFVLDRRFLETLRRVRPELVFLCNPNNPTGRLTSREYLLEIAACCQELGAALMVDECFLDMAEDGESYSLKTELERYPNLLILKAFTKTFAMAGLRLGYLLCSDAGLRDRLWAAGQPWSVSAAAQRCGVAALEDTAYWEATRLQLPVLRRELWEALQRLPVTAYPSAANYFLFYTDREGLAEYLLQRGILLRDCSNYPGLRRGYYRTAVRTAPENRRLIAALEAFFQERT